jgi:Anti-sigma-28 factor, FlgM
MDEYGEKVAEIKDKVAHGEYRVDSREVADAILRRLRELAAARREHVQPHERQWAAQSAHQVKCSYPESWPGASVNVTLGGPSSTCPTHVRPGLIARLAHALSISSRAMAGTHTHSS